VSRPIQLLIGLYPARWRRRYGAELEQLVYDMRPSISWWALATDLLLGAFDAHIHQGLDMQTTDRRAIKRGILIAGIVWVGLSIEVVRSNVVFPSKADDDTVSVLLSYLCVFAALFLIGALAGRSDASGKGQILAGLIGGAMIGALTIATFAVVDNVWLDIVSQQQAKIDGFAHSGAASMRDYINNGLIGGGVFLTLALGVFGAALSRLGGAVSAGSRAPAAPLR
jgi:hypothetical protein